MPVETRYVVIRDGVELKTFMDKKQADQYDLMLEQADALSELISRGPVSLEEAQLEALSIFLAEQKDELLQALGKKPKPKPAAKPAPAKAS